MQEAEKLPEKGLGLRAYRRDAGLVTVSGACHALQAIGRRAGIHVQPIGACMRGVVLLAI